MRTHGMIVLLLGFEACGAPQGTAPPVVAPETALPAPPIAAHPPTLQMQTELGEIDRKEVIKAFERLKPTFLECHKKGLERVEYLEGEVKFFVRVGQDGSVRWTYLEDSTLGDFATETCMLDAIRHVTWPKPQGGDGEVRSATGFEPPNVRPPAQWGSDKIAAVLAKDGAAASKCKAGAGGKFRVTAYVQPFGKGGKVQSVGLSVPNKEGSAAAECIVKEVMGWPMPSPGSWASKVSFDL